VGVGVGVGEGEGEGGNLRVKGFVLKHLKTIITKKIIMMLLPSPFSQMSHDLHKKKFLNNHLTLKFKYLSKICFKI
jgi:hypothetical protein